MIENTELYLYIEWNYNDYNFYPLYNIKMITLYPIFQNDRLQFDFILDKNWKKYIDWFNRYWILINFNTKKYWIWQKEYRIENPIKLLKRFWIYENDKNNINGLTVKQAIQNWINYINWKIKYL